MRAIDENFEFVTPEMILLEALENDSVRTALEMCNVDSESMKIALSRYIPENTPVLERGEDEEVEFTPSGTVGLSRIYVRAEAYSSGSGNDEMDIFDLMVMMFEDENLFCSRVLAGCGLEKLPFLEAVSEIRRENSLEKYADENDSPENSPDSDSESNGAKKILSEFTVDMTEKARKGEYDALIGREEELERTIQILSRRTKNNPVHVGDAGVGKTAIAQGLAQRIAEGKVPERLRGYSVYSLEVSSLVAGTKYRGEFESRLRKIISALEKIGKCILYIDEMHTLVGAGAVGGGNLDASNMLKPILSGGSVRVMGATTHEEFSRFVEKSRALSRRFQKIEVSEPSRDDSIRILRGLAPRYEEFHSVTYPQKSISAAVDLSVQYLPDRRLPDKAIDLIDEAGVLVSLQNESRKKRISRPSVTEAAIRKVASKMSGVPLENVTKDESEKFRNLETSLRSKIFGQDEAVRLVSLAVKKARAGFGNPDKPEASFLFVGPTGVGKTELARTLSEFLGEKLIRFDMSEYQEQYTVSRLIGSAPGYVGYESGGQLTEEVRKSPHSIVLFDEIEKAHEDIYNILLQVLDYGTLTDNQGRKADFRNCLIIFTSNAGAREMERSSVGFSTGMDLKKGEDASLKEAVAKVFSPEFRNRLDAIVPFSHLDEEITLDVAKKAVSKIAARLSAKKIDLSVSDDVLRLVAKKGYSREFGARNIARTAEELISSPLVDEVLFGKLSAGGSVRASIQDGEIKFEYGENK